MADLPRQVQLGSKGRDVVAYKRALPKLGDLPPGRPPGPVLDQPMDAACGSFRPTRGSASTGRLGPLTFARLAPSIDAFGLSLLDNARQQLQSPTAQRPQIVAAGYLG